MASYTQMISKLELKLLKKLYCKYKKTKRRELWLCTDAFKFLNIKDEEDISPLHDSPYFSTVQNGTHESYQITAEGVTYMDNYPPILTRLSRLLKENSVIFGLMLILILLALGYKVTTANLFGLGFISPSTKMNVETSMKQDARTVADSIIITGWEEPGDHIGDLSKITSFYSKYRDIYPVEFETYNRQLIEWQDRLKIKADRGEIIWAADEDGLMGLVRSGDNHLEEIAKNEAGVTEK